MLSLLAAAALFAHDSAERYPLASVGDARVAVPGAQPPEGPTAYRRRTGEWVQLWLFFPDNPHDRGILRTGRHAGDWEMVQMRPGREIVLTQHSGAERCPWSRVRLRDGLPVIHVAHGSHALYLSAGVHDRTWPDPNDESDGRGPLIRPRVVDVGARHPAWMRWPERWGGARASWVPGESDSPRGPAFQGVRWDDPDAFARSARACGPSAADRAEAAMTAAAAALALLAATAVRRRRRR